MAQAQLINAANCISMLRLSTQSRSDTPDGNIFFNTDTGELELITREELSQVDLGDGLEDNPLTDYSGIMMIAIYKFENDVREKNEFLQNYRRWTDASYKYAGAYELINGRKFAGNDRQKIRSSGWIERSTNNDVNRIYFCPRSLNHIDSDSVPYYQFAAEEDSIVSAPTIDFYRSGPVDEGIQVYGSTANGDTDAGDFDYRNHVLVLSVRKFGNNYGRTTSVLSGLTELSGYTAGFGLGESANDQNDYDIADVYGDSASEPWASMSLEGFTDPQTRSGFNDGSAQFSYVLNNPQGGKLREVRAYLDALAIQDADIDIGDEEIYGKRDETWYSVDSQGRVMTRAGLHIDGLPASDMQSIVQVDDTGTRHTYPFNVEVRVAVGNFAVADEHCWYRALYYDGSSDSDYDTPNAVTVEDAEGNPISGYCSADAQGNNEIVFTYDYDGNTQAGLPAGTDKEIVFIAEGNGIATQQTAVFTIVRQARVTASCIPSQETNA